MSKVSDVYLAGGCLCGAVRYQIKGSFEDVGFCHCSLCRKASGSPTTAWLTTDISNFQYTEGKPASYQSSAVGRREFCHNCGTQLAFYTSEAPNAVDITLGSLDEPEAVQPQYHIWCEYKVGWLSIADGLPRFDDAGPDGVSPRE